MAAGTLSDPERQKSPSVFKNESVFASGCVTEASVRTYRAWDEEDEADFIGHELNRLIRAGKVRSDSTEGPNLTQMLLSGKACTGRQNNFKCLWSRSGCVSS